MKMRISDQEIEFIRLKDVIIYKSAAAKKKQEDAFERDGTKICLLETAKQ